MAYSNSANAIAFRQKAKSPLKTLHSVTVVPMCPPNQTEARHNNLLSAYGCRRVRRWPRHKSANQAVHLPWKDKLVKLHSFGVMATVKQRQKRAKYATGTKLCHCKVAEGRQTCHSPTRHLQVIELLPFPLPSTEEVLMDWITS